VYFARNSLTTEAQRTQRLHREERHCDFYCKATQQHKSAAKVEQVV
jgi:hypothetical protein